MSTEATNILKPWTIIGPDGKPTGATLPMKTVFGDAAAGESTADKLKRGWNPYDPSSERALDPTIPEWMRNYHGS